ncbi:unnamed protein product [Notodromas monacha]|uniref:ribonuclease H n=1 Tax=Notodromas monacha TaxID=399045 RepID=A0A7R9BZ90_9CRUS|nr:unnamed protein product [Notodromas monacha]CAG0923564.1 unnamed protein product [Notodromas monacha]
MACSQPPVVDGLLIIVFSNIAEPVKDDKPHTNNRSKILSVAYAVEFLKAAGIKKAVIHVDSEFTLNCVDKWRPNWKKKDWKTAAGVDVKNKEELKLLDKVSTIEINYSMAADTNEPSGYSEATRLSKEGAKKTHD